MCDVDSGVTLSPFSFYLLRRVGELLPEIRHGGGYETGSRHWTNCCTVRHHGLAHDKLLMVEMIDPQGNPDGQCAVAIDNIGAGTGEWVLLVSGSSARQAHKSETSPVDLCVIGIVDEVVSGGQVIFHK